MPLSNSFKLALGILGENTAVPLIFLPLLGENLAEVFFVHFHGKGL